MLHTIDMILSRIWERKYAFFGVFFSVTVVTYGFLFAIDFIPEPPKKDARSTEDAEVMKQAEEAATSAREAITNEQKKAAEEAAEAARLADIAADPVPIKIIFDSLQREVAVLNPTTRSIADLDQALLKGAVRHPDSADFSEPGNIFILGHSSYLPNVFNKNFQAFNGIQNLAWGDTIRLQSEGTEYKYFVEKVFKARASEVVVPMTPGKAKLTLATCNSFGSKDDRFVVEAKLIESNPIQQENQSVAVR